MNTLWRARSLASAWVVLAVACGGSPPEPPTVPDVAKLPIAQTGAGPTQRLLAADATITLPDREGAEVETHFELTEFSEDSGGKGCLVAELPFRLNRAQERDQPDGITVTVDGAEVSYIPWVHTKDKGWRISRSELHVTGFSDIESAVLDYPNLADRADRFEPGKAGLEPADFVTMRYAAGAVSRPGLLLPAPAHARWEVTVEPGQRLESSIALAVPPGLTRGSDGVYAVARFVEGDKVTELGRHFVGPQGWLSKQLSDLDVTVEDPFLDWVISLDPVAGRTGSLELAAVVSGSETQDYLFVGHPTITSAPTAPPRHVVVIGLDTTRPDRLGLYGYDKPTSPHLDAFAEHAAVFDAAWTPAPRTRPSFRSSTTGRYPLAAVGAPNIGEVFQANGFATAGIVANVHLNPRFGFDRGFDLWRLNPKAVADEQVTAALEWLTAHQHRDAYLFLHLIDPHLFYKAPAAYNAPFIDTPDPEFTPDFNRWSITQLARRGELTDLRKDHIRGMYAGELAFTSEQLGRLFDGMDALGTQTLVVVHSDHGEELWEHGGFEHNHTLYDEVTKAVLVVRPPDGAEEQVRSDVPAALVDIAPTLYDYLEFPDVPESDGISLRPFIDGDGDVGEHADRPIGVAHLMYDKEQWGVVFRGHKYVIRTEDGAERLFDLKADPEELTDISETTDLEPFREALSRAHLDMPVGHGWRLKFSLKEPLIIHLPKAAEAAGLIDPEALLTGRANQAWGQEPSQYPDEVATVALSEDGRKLTIVPKRGLGVAWVRFAEETPTRKVSVRRDGQSMRIFYRRGLSTWEQDREHLVVAPGIVLDTPETEASRIARQQEASGEDLELLEALGYLGEHER